MKTSQAGQALTEYLVLTMVIAGMAMLINRFMPKLFDAMEQPIKVGLRQSYKYGDPKGCGFDTDDPQPLCSGAPSRHPRYDVGGDNFRLFGRGKK